MGEVEPKWGIRLDKTFGNFLLGANFNIGRWNGKWNGYLCIYLGFVILVVGKDVGFDTGDWEE
ncbi:hypothetical protein D3C75_688710 [compost metagenome]